MDMERAKELAREFASNIVEVLSVDQRLSMVQANKLDQYHDKCASEDYCNAGEAMRNALVTVAISEEDPDFKDLVGEAWSLARKAEFIPENI